MNSLLVVGLSFGMNLFSQGGPSVDSLNQQMNELERLLGVSPDRSVSKPKNQAADAILVSEATPLVLEQATESNLPASLLGIERKLKELESLVGGLPEGSIVKEAKNDPWLYTDPNSTISLDEMPRVEISTGMVVRYLPSDNSFIPVNDGETVKTKTLFVIPSGSELVISFVGKSAVRFGENSRVVFGPAEKNKQFIDLRSGTVSAYLNPERDLLSSPQFGIRTRSGTIEATGTFYAVTEYNGQAYTAVKSGTVKKSRKAHLKLDFASYLEKPSSNQVSKPVEELKVTNRYE
jgi:hypothetical protein